MYVCMYVCIYTHMMYIQMCRLRELDRETRECRFICVCVVGVCGLYTHTHTYIYIYIYIHMGWLRE